MSSSLQTTSEKLSAQSTSIHHELKELQGTVASKCDLRELKDSLDRLDIAKNDIK